MSSVENFILERTGDAAPVVPMAGAAAIDISIVGDMAGLEALEPEWNALFQTAGEPRHLFQTHAFTEMWARIFLDPTAHEHAAGTRCTCRCRLAIVTARRNGRLVLVWPLVLQHKLGLDILSWLGEPVAQYADLLIDPTEADLPLMRRAFETVVAAFSPDILRMRRVRQDAAGLALLAAIGATAMNPVEAPFASLGRIGADAGFDDRQSAKAKKNRRRLLRRLEEQGRIAFEVHSGTAAAGALVDTALAAKRGWIARRGLPAPALADARFDAFLRTAAADPSAACGCRVYALTLDGRPVAIAVGFVCKQRLMLHLIAHDEDVEKFGAGLLNLESIMRRAEAEGLTAVDMLPPTADYKLQWADGAVPVADHTLALTKAGRAYVVAVDRVAKPAVKRVLQALPLSARQRIARRQFHHA